MQAVYRLLARRWQSRLTVLLSQQDRQDENARHEELSDLFDLAGGNQDNDNMVVRFENRSTLTGLRSMLQQLGDTAQNEGDDNNPDEEANVAAEEPAADIMEEDVNQENEDNSDDDDDLLEFFGDDNESESDEFASAAEEESDENESVIMQDVDGAVDDAISKGQRAVDQPRSVSMSSDDL